MVDLKYSIAEKIAKKITIPPRPELLIQVSSEIQSEEPNLLVIADILCRDVSMAAAMLKMVNSPAYGLSNKISSVQKATMLLGLKNVERIVTVVTLRNEISGKLDLNSFWESAAKVAEVSAQVAAIVNLAPTDDAYTLGLFRNCGIPLMMQAFPDYLDIMAQSESDDVSPATVLEDKHYGTNHCDVGQHLCETWYLPESICDAIYFHHQEETLENNKELTVAVKNLLIVLMIAEKICQTFSGSIDKRADARWAQNGAEVLTAVGLDEEAFLEIQDDMITSLRNQTAV